MLDLAKLREKRAAGEKGFTLIELLVVVVIIGILIAIAIPVYLNYKKGAADKSSQSDLRNAVNTLEQCNVDNPNYPTAIVRGGTAQAPTNTYTLTGCTGQTLNVSDGTTLSYLVPASGAAVNYDLLAYNSNGSSTSTTAFCYASATGGAIKQRTAALSAYAATC